MDFLRSCVLILGLTILAGTAGASPVEDARPALIAGKHLEVLEKLATEKTPLALAYRGLATRRLGRPGAEQLFSDVLDQADESSQDPHDMEAMALAMRELGDFQGSMSAAAQWQKSHPADVRARVFAGDLFLSKYQTTDALTEYDAAIEIAPEDGPARVGRARALLEKGDLEESRQLARRVIDDGKADPAAHVLLARIFSIEEDLVEMRRNLEAALALDEGHEEALCYLAVAELLDGKPEGVARIEERARKGTPRLSRLYWNLGEAMSLKREVIEARAYYEKALKADPTDAEIHASLGALLMREGEEDKARESLELAFERDGFDFRTLNFLKILDLLDRSFSTRVSKHFLVRVDEKVEGYLVDLYLARMEEVYQDLVTRYGYEPPGSVILEIFPRSDWFAGRISGLPWIGITAGCFGRVVAAESPRIHPGTSHRDEVMMHELVHVVNLEQSLRRVPMWFAEGLATREEAQILRPQSLGLLAGALATGDLKPLSQLNAGFTRPTMMAEKHLAYFQAGLLCDHIEKTHGFEKLLAMIEGFRQGKSPDQVYRGVFGKDEKAMDEVALQVWRQVARTSPVSPIFMPGGLEKLAQKAKSEEPRALLDHAAALMSEDSLVPALREAEKAREKAPPKSLELAEAHALLGDLTAARKNREVATRHYLAALEADPARYRALAGLARLHGEAGRLGDAEDLWRKAAAAHPYMPEPLQELHAILEDRGDTGGMILTLEALVKADLHDAAPMHRLARLYMEAKRPKDALELYRHLAVTDTLDPGIHLLAAQAEEDLGRPEQALPLRVLGLRLQSHPWKPESNPGDGFDALVTGLEDKDPMHVRATLLALVENGDPRVPETLSGSLKHADGRVRVTAAAVMARLGRDDGVEILIGALGEKDLDRALASRVLSEMSAQDHGSDGTAWKSWWEKAKSQDATSRRRAGLEAGGFTARWDDGDEAVPVLIRALASEKWPVCWNAHRELEARTGQAFGRGLFGPPEDHHQVGLEDGSPLRIARQGAVARWTSWWDKSH